MPTKWRLGLWIPLIAALGFGLPSETRGQCQIMRLSANDSDGGDEFGFAVSISGDYAIAGAPRNDDTADNAGSAYVFRRQGSSWTEKTELLSPDPALNDFFGASVAIDGDYAAVAAVLDDEAGENAGAVYVFHRSGSAWNFQFKLTANDADADDELGTSLAIDGDYIVAGARNDDAGTSSGCAYVFVRNGATWSQQQKLTAQDAAGGDEFGTAVAISGEYIAIGSPSDNTATADTGSVYVFKRSGTLWAQQIRLLANDAAMGNELGRAVSISGEYIIAGARLAEIGEFNNAGAAYVFKRNGTVWAQQAKLIAGDPENEDLFGVTVAISGDYALVGAIQDDDGGTSSGSTYVYRRNGTTWPEDGKLTAGDDDPGDQFGFAVSISGGVGMISAPYVDDFGLSTGTAYIFGVGLDCNGNGDPDSCDILSGLSSDRNGDGVPDECGSVGGDFDFDNDGDVDFRDFRDFQTCFNRGGGLLSGCGVFDGEPDGDVDLDDYLMFEIVFDDP